MTVNCSKLIKTHSKVWQKATQHPFLEQCQSGEIKIEQFNAWLCQDYLFVTQFTRFVATVLAGAPPEHFDVILSGLGALREELVWFRAKLEEYELTSNVPLQPTCQDYCDYLVEVAQKPYPVLATALWTIEFAYNQAWQGEMAQPYREFADRWGNSRFTDYVKMLEQQADEALENTSSDTQEQAEEVFLQIAKLEQDFWQMAFNEANS